MNCSVCRTELVEKPHQDTVETGVCGDCRKTLGVVPMGQPVRPPVPCLRCNAMQFTRVMPRLYNGPPIPFPITHEPDVMKGMFSDRIGGTATRTYGDLEMYICHGCGYVEWYCRAPRQIPIGAKYMSELIDYSPQSAYRE
jgi:hypothetical protein